MNTIILSSVISDPFGTMIFKFNPSKSEIYSQGRRVSKRGTLDGGSVFSDYGFTDSDREFNIETQLRGEQLDLLNYMIRNYSSIMVSVIDGLFLAALESTTTIGSNVKLKILIKEKLA